MAAQPCSTSRPPSSRSAGAGCASTSVVVVGGHDHGGAHPVHLAEEPQHPPRLRRVQVAGRLVRHQERRADHHRAGDGDALLLAAGKRCGQGVGAAFEADPAQHLGDVGADLRFRPPGDPERQGEVVGDRQVRQQAEILVHHANAAPEARQRGAARAREQGAEQFHLAPARPEREVHQAQQCGFAGARGSEQPMEAAFGEGKGNVAQRLRSPLRPGFGERGIPEADAVEPDHGADNAAATTREPTGRRYGGGGAVVPRSGLSAAREAARWQRFYWRRASPRWWS